MNYPPYNPYQNVAAQGMMPNQMQGYGIQSPYANALQQPMQTTVHTPLTTTRGITGRIVSAESEVAPGEVPTDNTVGYYPSADGNVIWAKTWNTNGGIETREYVLKEITPEPVADPFQPVIDRLEKIETVLQDLKPKTRTRKAADDE